VLNEVHAGEIRAGKNFLVPEVVVLTQLGTHRGTTNHGLKHQPPPYLLDDLVEGVQRIAQMVKHAHEQHVVELSRELIHIVGGVLGKLHAEPKHFRGKTGLAEVAFVNIYSQNPAGAPFLELQAVETGVAANVQNRHPSKVLGDMGGHLFPFDSGKVSQEVTRSSGDSVQVEVMEPFPHLRDAALEILEVKLPAAD